NKRESILTRKVQLGLTLGGVDLSLPLNTSSLHKILVGIFASSPDETIRYQDSKSGTPHYYDRLAFCPGYSLIKLCRKQSLHLKAHLLDSSLEPLRPRILTEPSQELGTSSAWLQKAQFR